MNEQTSEINNVDEVDSTGIEVTDHIVIRDLDTNKTILRKRGATTAIPKDTGNEQ